MKHRGPDGRGIWRSDRAALSWSLPPAEHFDGRIGKRAFRRAIRSSIPPSVSENPVKRGFGVPPCWMTGTARPWIRGLFENDPASAGFVRPEAALDIVGEHMTGRRNFSRRVWALLNLELWSRIYLRGETPESLAMAGN